MIRYEKVRLCGIGGIEDGLDGYTGRCFEKRRWAGAKRDYREFGYYEVYWTQRRQR
ncbi:hypothetical protein [Paraburkholderia sp. SIMBA_030]|uniref:hypothetical protein n=1 Tax=Paraburkholderia sp. SIMBA_030 TaxID=3085773 RepID=UPI0039793699